MKSAQDDGRFVQNAVLEISNGVHVQVHVCVFVPVRVCIVVKLLKILSNSVPLM